MTDRQPIQVTNLDRYGNPALPWSRAYDLLAFGPRGPLAGFFLGAYIGLSVPVIGLGIATTYAPARNVMIVFVALVGIAVAVSVRAVVKRSHPEPLVHDQVPSSEFVKGENDAAIAGVLVDLGPG